MNAIQKKELFLERYAKLFNRSAAMKNVCTPRSLYKWIADDKVFADAILAIEMSLVSKAEETYFTLLKTGKDNIKFKVAKEIINSKLGKKHSNLCADDDSDLIITDSKIEYIIR